jgi:hypothetical protein
MVAVCLGVVSHPVVLHRSPNGLGSTEESLEFVYHAFVHVTLWWCRALARVSPSGGRGVNHALATPNPSLAPLALPPLC